jgi:hypothetical protein
VPDAHDATAFAVQIAAQLREAAKAATETADALNRAAAHAERDRLWATANIAGVAAESAKTTVKAAVRAARAAVEAAKAGGALLDAASLEDSVKPSRPGHREEQAINEALGLTIEALDLLQRAGRRLRLTNETGSGDARPISHG